MTTIGALLLVGSASSLSWAAGPGVPGLSIPLHALKHRCTDARFPRLAGGWVVGCGPTGDVDRALSLESGRVIELPRALSPAGTGPGFVVGAGRRGGLFALTESGAVEVPDTTRITEPLLAPPATDGTHLAVLSERGLQAFPATERARTLHEARPMGWHPPALVWPWVAWVEDAGDGDADVWVRDVRDRRAATAMAKGPARQDRVVAAGAWFAWVDDGAVVLHEPATGSTRRVPAETGFRAPPAVWQGEACWEVRAADVDIACTDLPGVSGPGHQGWPDRWGPWLLYRDGERPMLYTAPDPAE
jgi:hypothetical protein